MGMKLKPFVIAEHLVDQKMVALYLSAVLEEEDPPAFISALRHVAQAARLDHPRDLNLDHGGWNHQAIQRSEVGNRAPDCLGLGAHSASDRDDRLLRAPVAITAASYGALGAV